MEAAPGGDRILTSGAKSGFTTLGGGAGLHRWKFSKPGHLTVWREAELELGQVRLIPSPWLAELSEEAVPFAIVEETNFDTRDGTASVRIPPGAFSQAREGAITALDGQTLPSPLPTGSSPLAAFHLELTRAPAAQGSPE